MNAFAFYQEGIEEHKQLLNKIGADSSIQRAWEDWVRRAVDGYNNDESKIYFCGNGGSAADAQHLAAELSGRFEIDRPPLFAEALHVNTSYLTAVANDYGYDKVYERATRAFLQKGDILVALSTSGRSPNILNAARTARELGATVVALTGQAPNPLQSESDICLAVPSQRTARIQEMHMLLGHLFCQAVERELFPHASE
jgi:D-sedoheptulose 7-phosphate isomerase